MQKKLIRVVSRDRGYELREEEWWIDEEEKALNGVTRHVVAYTFAGDYIGSQKDADFLVVECGIQPEKRQPDHCVCSCGWSAKHQKWYGWSHRAIVGFGIGDKLFEEAFPGKTEQTPFTEHGTVTITDLAQAKQAAANFAAYIS